VRANAYGASARALVSIITELGHQIDAVQAQVVTHFGRRPDGEIYLSQPGLGHILSARSWPSSETLAAAMPMVRHVVTTLELLLLLAPRERKKWS
jgi:transposase